MINNPTKSLAWPFVEKFLRLFLGTGLTLLVARQIGPADFGVFSTVFAVFMLFSALASMGMKDVVIDEIASGRTAANQVISTSFLVVFVGSIVSSIVFIALIKFLYSGYGLHFWVACFLAIVLLMKCFEVLLYGLEAHSELRSISIVQQTSIILGAICKITILYYGATVFSFAAVTAVEFIVLFIAAFVIASRNGLKISKNMFPIEYSVGLIKRSWPLAASSFAVIGYFYIDQVIIAILMDSEAVGVYAAASRISQQLYILPTVLVAAYYPRLTQIYASKPSEFERGFIVLSVVLLTLALLVWSVVFFIGEPLLDRILGENFKGTASILGMHAIGLVFVSLNVIGGRWYVMNWLQKLTLVRQLLTAIMNVLLNFILIPIFGLEGAVYATLVSLFFLTFGFDLFSARTQKLAKLKMRAVYQLGQPKMIRRAFRKLVTL